MENEIEYIWFTRIKINSRLKDKLLEKFGSIKNFFNCSLDDLVYFNVENKDIRKILDLNLRKAILYEYNYLKENNIGVLSCENEKYPEKLRNIDDYPKVIFYKGNIEILNDLGIGIIGSRLACKESLENSRKIAKEISQNGYCIISGLALGVDKFAHLGALDVKNGKTIAVLGSGLDEKSFYPRENRKVFERIIENDGLIISEFPVGTIPLSYNFPYRNRIISGLSEKIIVIQAGEKSGSLITVDYALNQGKDVYVLRPLENINKKYFKGNIALIEEGAKIYENIEDIKEF